MQQRPRTMNDQTLAFAGMLQTGELVRQIATSGICSQRAAEASIDSVFNMDPESAADVYGGIGGARMGLRVAVELFSGRAKQDSLHALNYAMALGKLAAKLKRDRKRQAELGHELTLIEAAWQEAESGLDDSVVSQLADAYQRHISSLDMRITVNGRPEYLKQSDKVATIRALLLAGLRSAMLWQQLGGRHWRLVFQRKRMLREANELLTA